MRISVAGSAVFKCDPFIFYYGFLVLHQKVALVARQFLMSTLQAEARACMIEFQVALPSGGCVTGFTVERQLPVMRIAMALGTFLGKPKKSAR